MYQAPFPQRRTVPRAEMTDGAGSLHLRIGPSFLRLRRNFSGSGRSRATSNGKDSQKLASR